ncbi:MAG: DNA methylase [Bacteroides sp.]|nr:DNA methylase [Bacteroides sp.]
MKSFYASVECVERGLDALDTNLVVADASRTNKTICLAVSPSLKKHGTGGRPRLFEVEQRVRDANSMRRSMTPGLRNRGKSYSARCLDENPSYEIDYIVAPPRMALYLDYSTRIYDIYLRHVSAADVHVYSIDEVFIDVTGYLPLLKITAHEFALRMVREVLSETGITATAGIGTNMYLAKVAMDIVAKHMEPDGDGVRIAELDEASYRRKMWNHRPLTDFWRVGRGIARRLADYGLLTMGDVARCSIHHESTLYGLFGVNAELLIDHAWGWEPVTIADVKSYQPVTHSLSSGQVLSEPYSTEKARIVIMEMAEGLALDLLKKHLDTDSLTMTIGYDTASLQGDAAKTYTGQIGVDHYGRCVPVHSHGSIRLAHATHSQKVIIENATVLFDRIVGEGLLIRRLNICANNTVSYEDRSKNASAMQLVLFDDAPTCDDGNEVDEERDNRLHTVVAGIKQRYGKNAILKGLNFAEGATARQRNGQIGGHKA